MRQILKVLSEGRLRANAGARAKFARVRGRAQTQIYEDLKRITSKLFVRFNSTYAFQVKFTTYFSTIILSCKNFTIKTSGRRGIMTPANVT